MLCCLLVVLLIKILVLYNDMNKNIWKKLQLSLLHWQVTSREDYNHQDDEFGHTEDMLWGLLQQQHQHQQQFSSVHSKYMSSPPKQGNIEPYSQLTSPLDQSIFYKCNYCSLMFRKQEDAEKHKEQHMKGKFACSFCNYRCMWKCNLEKHIRIHTGEKPFACPQCDYRAVQKHHLLSHMKIHKTDQQQ